MKLKLLFVLLFVTLGISAKQPNILYIMSDDHTTQGIGAYGSRLAVLNPTPTIDRLAHEGALFKNTFCTNAICTPSRASIITSQYSHVNGVKTLVESIPVERQYLAHWMKDAGYETAMVGKWHLHEEPASFDYYAVLGGQGWYFNPIFRVRGQQPWPKNEFQFKGYDCVHSSDAITRLSLTWLKNREEKGKKPFFLMHHFKAPHDNFENAERYDFLYEDDVIPEPESLWKRKKHGPLNSEQYGTSVGKRNERRNMGDHMFVDENLGEEEYKRVAYQRYMKKYLRTVKGVDDNLKKLLDHLEETGELDNTIIIYTGDQGFMLGEHDYIDKRWMYEESLRMPFIVWYPQLIKAGTVVDAIVNNTDFAPTIVDLAGGEIPDGIAQGRSFAEVLSGKTLEHRDATYYRYWMHMAHHDNPAHFGIRTKTHKLIFFYGMGLDANGVKAADSKPHWELYDLKNDPKEMNNVFEEASYITIRKQLAKQLVELRKEVGDSDEAYPELKALFEKDIAKMLEG